MKTGIILEINDDDLTMLTPDGQFLRARKLHEQYELGQEIDFLPIDIKSEKNGGYRAFTFFKNWTRTSLATAALVMVLLTATLFPVVQRNKVYAYMTIDSKSSIEVAVNRNLEVIELIPYNEEAEKIVQEIEKKGKNQDLSTVTTEVLSKMEQVGTVNDHIVISTVYEGKRDSKADKKINKELETLKTSLSKNHAEVTIVKATKSERKKALNKGITTGKYKQKKAAKAKDEQKPKSKNGQAQKQDQKKLSKQKHNQWKKDNSKNRERESDMNKKQQPKQKNPQSDNRLKESKDTANKAKPKQQYSKNKEQKPNTNLSKKSKASEKYPPKQVKRNRDINTNQKQGRNEKVR